MHLKRRWNKAKELRTQLTSTDLYKPISFKVAMLNVNPGTDFRVLTLMFPPGTGRSTSRAPRPLKERRNWLTLDWFMVVVMWWRYVAMRSWLVSISSCYGNILPLLAKETFPPLL